MPSSCSHWQQRVLRLGGGVNGKPSNVWRQKHIASLLARKSTHLGEELQEHPQTGAPSLNLASAVVVTLSLCLELALKGVAQEAASLLMFFRLWKYTPEFLRVARHAPEAAEIARVARHSPEVARILSHTPEFLRAFRHSPELARVARHIPEFLRVFRHVPEFFRFARHTPELFRLWRVARIAHGAAAAMELHSAKEAEEQRHLLTRLQKVRWPAL